MTEIGIAEYFGMAEALGIIATLFVILYFSRKQMQTLSVDIETKILNDLDERIHGITQMGVEKPDLIRVIYNVDRFRYGICISYFVYICTCVSYATKRSSI
jgi:hypothetical protein